MIYYNNNVLKRHINICHSFPSLNKLNVNLFLIDFCVKTITQLLTKLELINKNTTLYIQFDYS